MSGCNSDGSCLCCAAPVVWWKGAVSCSSTEVVHTWCFCHILLGEKQPQETHSSVTCSSHPKKQVRVKGKHPGRHEAIAPCWMGTTNTKNNVATVEKKTALEPSRHHAEETKASQFPKHLAHCNHRCCQNLLGLDSPCEQQNSSACFLPTSESETVFQRELLKAS